MKAPKRLSGILLVIAFALGLLPLSATAQFTVVTNSNSTLTLTGYTGPGGNVIIPENINGLTVTSIGVAAFAEINSLTSVIIPDTVTNIGQSAFIVDGGLTNVIIGSGVTSIGNGAFQSSGLTSVVIPASVTNIADSAFEYIPSLASVTFSYGLISLGNVVFQGDGNLASVTIPDSVSSIGGGAFGNDGSLTNVSIGSGVTNIGSGAFSGCSSLTAINVDSSNPAYSSIAGVLFNAGQTTLLQFPGGYPQNSYAIPGTVTNILAGAFSGCVTLTSITIPGSFTNIGDYAFQLCYSLASVTVPDSVTSIGANAFGGDRSLTTVSIGTNVTSIGNYAFENCGALTTVKIPDSVTRLGLYAFEDDGNLMNVSLGSHVASIGSNAFYNCSLLPVIRIPGSVTNIGGNAFAGCIKLTAVYFQGNAPNLTNDSSVFSGDFSNPSAYYLAGATGWGSTFDTIPTVELKSGSVALTNQSGLSAAAGGGGLVTFAFDGVIELTNTIPIFNNTVLDGTGHHITISGSNLVLLFTVYANATLTLTNITLANGANNAVFASDEYIGANVPVLGGLGGAIFNAGTVLAVNCAFTNNAATGAHGELDYVQYGFMTTPGSVGLGGAIYNLGNLTLSNCILAGNNAFGGGGSGGNWTLPIWPTQGGKGGGGAIYNAGIATIINCTFSNNAAVGGAGGSWFGGTYWGQAPAASYGGVGNGGGISSSGILAIFNSTFVGNHAVAGAGGNGNPGFSVNSQFTPGGILMVPGGAAGGGATGTGGASCVETGVLTVVNSTFSANSALGGKGGNGGEGSQFLFNTGTNRIWIFGAGGPGNYGGNGSGGAIGVLAGTASLTNVTLAHNFSTGGAAGTGGIGLYGPPVYGSQASNGPSGPDGLPGASQGQTLLSASNRDITLLNTILVCNPGATNGFGDINDAGYNLNSDATTYLTNSASFNGLNPYLGSLGNYGGLTPTIPLLPMSPAIDAGDPDSFPTTDQRGFPRPYGPAPCIGAFEYSSPVALVAGSAYYTRPSNVLLLIDVNNLLTNVTIAAGDSISLVGVGTDGSNLQTTNGATLVTNGSYILYTNSVTLNVNDSFVYTVSDAMGLTSTGKVFISVSNNLAGQTNPRLLATSSNITASFFGIPGYQYAVQRSTNLTQGSGWVSISTNKAPSDGLIRVVDNFGDLGILVPPIPASAYYRLLYNP